MFNKITQFPILAYKILKILPLIRISNIRALFIFILLGFLLYGNTLTHEYVLDDAIAITENEYTKKGFSGIGDHLSNDAFTGFYGEKKTLVAGGRYRPLSFVLFSIEHELFGLNPFMGHLFNILFYILNGFLIYMVLKILFRNYTDFLVPLSFLASIIWFFHPIHTEVVANIKGRDEILSFLFSLSSLYFVIKYYDFQKLKYLLFIFIFFFLGLLSKENTITWLAIIPLSIYFFREFEIKKIILPITVILLASLCWFFIRYQVVGSMDVTESVADNIMNDPFLYSTVSEKYATIVYTLGKYLQLMVFPHPLTYDYYPKHIPIVGWSNIWVVLSLIVYLALVIIAFWGFKRKSIITYGILFFLITLSIASNLIFPVGTFMNERFVYASSLGFAIIFAFLLYKMYLYLNIEKSKNKAKFILGITLGTILFLYSIKTISRNFDWKDNLTLATHDANISVKGAKSNVMAGGQLLEDALLTQNPNLKQQKIEQAHEYLNRALAVYPTYIDALLLKGNAEWELSKNAPKSMEYYTQILNINPSHINAWQNIHAVLIQNENKDYSIAAYEKLIQFYHPHAQSYINLGRLYGQFKNNIPKAISILEEGEKHFPQNIDILGNLGVAYGLQQDYENAVRVLEKAEALRPNNSKIKIDLGLSYYYMGKTEEAKKKFNLAVQLDPTLDRSQFPI